MLKQQEMNLVKLIEDFGTEDECRAHLIKLRGPDGVRCLRCGSDKVPWLEEQKKFQCRSCRYQCSVTAGTIFHDTHLPLWKWFLAVYLIIESKKGISANEVTGSPSRTEPPMPKSAGTGGTLTEAPPPCIRAKSTSPKVPGTGVSASIPRTASTA